MQYVKGRRKPLQNDGSRQRRRDVEEEIIAKIDAERFWNALARDLLDAIKARDVKRQRKLKMEAVEQKDSLELLDAIHLKNINKLFALLESKAVRYVPPPRPDGEVATLTLSIHRPEIGEDAPQLQIESDAG